jgi:hypothetical protein
VQASLKVGAVDDPLEHEADRFADQIAWSSSNSTAVDAAGPTRSATAATSASAPAPQALDQVLGSHGEGLESGLRGEMEQHFHYDFSRVRVHRDAAAEASAQQLNANAYTVGDDIAFAPGTFSPATPQGRRLIAHELTHVVQQSQCNRQSSGPGLVQRDSPPAKGADKDKAKDTATTKDKDQAKASDPAKDKPKKIDPKVEAAKAKLKDKFKLGDIKEEDGGSWTEGQLNKLYADFSKMKPAEQAKMEGVALTITGKKLTVEHKGKKVEVDAITYGGSLIQFTKGALRDPLTPLHEAGHVIKNKVEHEAQVRAFNSPAGQQVNTAQLLFKQAAGRLPRSFGPELGGFVSSMNQATAALQDLLDSTPETQEEKQTLVEAALGQTDMERMAIEKSSDPSAKAALEVHDRLRDSVAAAERFVDERTKMVKPRRDLTEFVEIVNKNHLAHRGFAPFTDYVRSFWPDKPDEFFAQSYATWRTDPNYMKTNARPLFDWFEKGEHMLPPEAAAPKQSPSWFQKGGQLLPKEMPKEVPPVPGEMAREAEATFLPAIQGAVELLEGGEQQ